MWALQRLRKLLTTPGTLTMLPALLNSQQVPEPARREENPAPLGVVPKSPAHSAIVPQSGA